MPAIMHQIVFTKKEIEEDSIYPKPGYKYKEIYKVFVGRKTI